MKEHVLDLGHILKNSAGLQASTRSPSFSYSPTSFAGSPVNVNRAVNSDCIIIIITRVFLFVILS